MPTDKQLEANRENAQRSTGPRTEDGKTRSSMNAVKTGLTGRTVLLPSEDAVAYQQFVQRLIEQLRPSGDDERLLVQSIADTEWRLLRIPSLESGIYALGRLEFAGLFIEEEDAVRAALIQAKTFLVYQKQLSNLSIQETRLRRQLEKDRARLVQMQTDRGIPDKPTQPGQPENYSQVFRRQRLTLAVSRYINCLGANQPFNPKDFGFEFSKEEIEDWGCTLGGYYAEYMLPIREKRAA
jgi:hypothetical protein